MASEPMSYRIRVRGRLDGSWSDRLGGMSIEVDRSDDRPTTTLTGELVDQSALSGVVSMLVDLHLVVLSVECVSHRPGTEAGERED